MAWRSECWIGVSSTGSGAVSVLASQDIEVTPEMVEAGEIAYYDAPEWVKGRGARRPAGHPSP
jgi:hypothetical protein